MILILMYAVCQVPMTLVWGTPDVWTTNHIVNQNRSKSCCKSNAGNRLTSVEKERYDLTSKNRYFIKSLLLNKKTIYHISIQTSEETKFSSLPIWQITIQWDAQKLRFLACLDKYDPMGSSKTSFPRLFWLICNKLFFI